MIIVIKNENAYEDYFGEITNKQYVTVDLYIC